VYGFIDASGEGFGGSTQILQHQAVLQLKMARIGFWCTEISEKSSNYQEFRNLAKHVAAESRAGILSGTEVWILTDNEVTERAWYSGTSSSKSLFDIMLELRHEQLRGNFVLHVVHLAGTRMMFEGTDALSRGEVHAQDLMDKDCHKVPLDVGAIEREPKLKDWILSWADQSVRFAEPVHWFEEATQQFDFSGASVTWVWDLPPAAAIHALEELGLGRNKRHESLRGIVLVPRLMRPECNMRTSKKRRKKQSRVIPTGESNVNQ
jgi:hypothetical protein